MYDAANRLQEDIAYAYTFDARGNLTQKVDKTTGERQVYAYNGDNRLIRFERYPSGSTSPDTTATYAYDPFGRRIQKTVNGQATHFQWDGASLIAEHDASGNATKRYHYAIGYAPVQVEDAHGVYQVHADHLNTPWYLTDASRQIVWQANYAPYGEAVTDEDPDGNTQAVTFNVRFPGQYFDTETGLHYNYFRDYDPSTSRYTTSDPIGLKGGMNTYNYVLGNPINLVDPEGLASSGITTNVPGTTATVRIDPPAPTHPNSQPHAHIKQPCKPEIVINKDGTGSHGTDPSDLKNKKIKDFLKKKGFKLPGITGLIPGLLEAICAQNPYDPACGIIEPLPDCPGQI